MEGGIGEEERWSSAGGDLAWTWLTVDCGLQIESSGTGRWGVGPLGLRGVDWWAWSTHSRRVWREPEGVAGQLDRWMDG